ncbi:Phosphoglycerate kinase [Candidatus Bealeia paramacronuclearis]|uniref:Phosphoglycerate kinase n=1 Tax=Candidatus Bealeia paramacronuclearis TaxID=1921001 RepID=A0ABZ2C2K5_9PROT|nr:Phosphoglycerate kinase [Candidatus Bealeia paramacronuclearis]
MKSYLTLDDVNTKGLRVLVRADLNVPLHEGVITDNSRLVRLLPTLEELIQKGAQVVLISHFGRPKGTPNPEFSLKPVIEKLKSLLPHANLIFSEDYETVPPLNSGDILVLENLRFHAGEEKNDMDFAKTLSAFGDIYVNDAFSASHRAHASIEAITHYLPSYAGRLMQEELEALGKALGNPERPLMAIVGGSKVSSKLALLLNLIEKVNILAIGGAMANTFLKAQGQSIGASLVEDNLLETAQNIMIKAQEKGCQILLPLDVIVAERIEVLTTSRIVSLHDIQPQDMILDIGALSRDNIAEYLGNAKTLLWNGPLGVFEVPPFDQGTTIVAQVAAKLTKSGYLLSVAGGGDTVAALNHAKVFSDFSYVSTAGGAFLEWLEGRELPGVASLKRSFGRSTNTVVPSFN